MNKGLEEVYIALWRLGAAVEDESSDDRALSEQFDWRFPFLTRQELAQIPRGLAERIDRLGGGVDDKTILTSLEMLPKKLNWVRDTLVPKIYKGDAHAVHAIPAYMAILEWARSLLDGELSWVHMVDSEMMPSSMAVKLREMSAQVNQVGVDRSTLEKQVGAISSAYASAKSWPSKLLELETTKENIAECRRESSANAAAIAEAKVEVDHYLESIMSEELRAQGIVDKCGEAFRIATSTGLAGAFDQRARKLSLSMTVWVMGLLLSLGAAWFVGDKRIDALIAALSEPTVALGVVVLHLILSFVSIGGPLWFAWLSTKQIGQRFKLAEDYAYKASVSKAYEGYRKEAERFDDKLQSRLFESAISRLEEAPLRLLDDKSHNSPWHEMLDSKGVQDAFNIVPGLRDQVFKVVEDAIEKAKKVEPVKSSDKEDIKTS